jgi:hypothetical protein
MLNRDDACRLAAEHISGRPALEGGYRLACLEPVEYPKGWYFGYRIEPLPPLSEGFCGAPGFLIRKADGAVQIISWHELRLLKAEHPPRK